MLCTECHYAGCRNAERRFLFIVTLNVILLRAIMLIVVMLNDIILSVVWLFTPESNISGQGLEPTLKVESQS
jgi:hypothetical protein